MGFIRDQKLKLREGNPCVLHNWFGLLPQSTPFSLLPCHLLAAQQDTLLTKALLSSWVWGTQEGVCVCRIYGLSRQAGD